MELKIKALSPRIGADIPAPFYASAGAAAMDLHACLDAPLTIPAGGRALIPTGLAVAIPCYVAYNYLVSRVNAITLDMEKAASEIIYFFYRTFSNITEFF